MVLSEAIARVVAFVVSQHSLHLVLFISFILCCILRNAILTLVSGQSEILRMSMLWSSSLNKSTQITSKNIRLSKGAATHVDHVIVLSLRLAWKKKSIVEDTDPPREKTAHRWQLVMFVRCNDNELLIKILLRQTTNEERTCNLIGEKHLFLLF